MKPHYTISLLFLLLSAGHRLIAQCPGAAATPFDPARGGILTTSGTLIFSQPGSQYTQDGGLDNSDGSTLEIQGDVYINGDLRLSNNSSIIVQNGGRLFVYGNTYVNNGSTLTVNGGGNLYFYGEEWINEAGAVVTNSSNAGSITFIMPRPAPGANDPVSGSARFPANATAYTATANTIQYLDGGGVDMAVNVVQQNANNISLCNLDASAAAGTGNTQLSGSWGFSAAGGDVVLNDNNFIFTATGGHVHNGINAYQGYFITNGTGVLSKQGLANSNAFIFATGQAENDYTPVTLTNTSGAVNDYFVQVKTYANSGSTEAAPQEGIDRTWQLYATTAGTANICLQHNALTSPSGTGTDGTAFTNATAFVTQQVSNGSWSPGTQTDGGSPISNHCAVYTIPATATDATSYFSKSSDPLSTLPVTLASFRGQVVNCVGQLEWTTDHESNSRKYVIEHSSNGVDYKPVGEVQSRNQPNGASYEYNYASMASGTNYFRLSMIDFDNRQAYSPVVSLAARCDTRIVITPNPVQGPLSIRGLQSGHEVTVVNAIGQPVARIRATGNRVEIDTQNWLRGIYMVIIKDNNEVVRSEKLVKP